MPSLRPPIPSRLKIPMYSKMSVINRSVVDHSSTLSGQVSNASNSTALLKKAEQELDELFNKLKIPQRLPLPHHDIGKDNRISEPEIVAEPATARRRLVPDDSVIQIHTKTSNEAAVSANRKSGVTPPVAGIDTRVPIQHVKAVTPPLLLGIAISISAVALFSAFMVYQVHDRKITANGSQLTLQHDAIDKLTQKVLTHNADTDARLAALQRLIAEVKYPPSEFDNARNLMTAGRYADAEAIYHSFLLRSPDSRVADVALHNAAVASAMQNNCSMSGAYLAQLKKRFPDSVLLIRSKNLLSQCKALRNRTVKKTDRAENPDN